MDLSMLEYAGIALVPLNMGLSEVVKQSGVLEALGLSQKKAGLVAIIAGVLEGVFLIHPGDIPSGIIVGLALGLSSVGLYSTGKNNLQDEDEL